MTNPIDERIHAIVEGHVARLDRATDATFREHERRLDAVERWIAATDENWATPVEQVQAMGNYVVPTNEECDKPFDECRGTTRIVDDELTATRKERDQYKQQWKDSEVALDKRTRERDTLIDQNVALRSEIGLVKAELHGCAVGDGLLADELRNERTRADGLHAENVRLRKQMDDAGDQQGLLSKVIAERDDWAGRAMQHEHSIAGLQRQVDEWRARFNHAEQERAALVSAKDDAIGRFNRCADKASEMAGRLYHVRRAVNPDTDVSQLDKERYGNESTQ